MKLKETVREDGLRIITVSLPHKKKVYVELTCRVGSAYDPEDRQGLFHFFEHMAFKGTKCRTNEDIQSFAQRHLFDFNAVTRPLSTSYYATAVHTKMSAVTDLLCDIYCNSIFPKEEIEKERRPILLEIARSEDNDAVVAFNTLRKVFWKKNPLRATGGGTKEGVHAVQRADIVREPNRWHVPAATVAIAIGKVDHDAFVQEIHKHIPINHKKVALKTWDDEHSVLPTRQRTVIKKPGRNKSIVMLGFKVPFALPDRISVFVCGFIESLISSTSGSRLYKEIREKRGLAYAVDGNFDVVTNLGRYYYAYIETSKEHISEVERLLYTAITEPLTSKKDFEEVHEGLVDSATLGFDDSFNLISGMITEAIAEKKPLSEIPTFYKKALNTLKTITLEEVEEKRKEFFQPERFATVVVEPK